MVRFEPTWEELELYKDGGVAIIDQWICSHARCSELRARVLCFTTFTGLESLTGQSSVPSLDAAPCLRHC